MKIPLQITFRHVPRSGALEAHIRQKAEKLEECHSRIVSCRVTVEELRKHHHQGHHFRVRIDLRVPGKEIVANHDHHEDVYVALRDAFDAVKRELEDAAREMRGDVKAHAVPQQVDSRGD
jgi:ribosomal subunit interface protein